MLTFALGFLAGATFTALIVFWCVINVCDEIDE